MPATSALEAIARPGRRELNKQRARRAMTAAALDLFWDGGYRTTTLEQLVERAEVSLRTFFRYFDSKEAVALAAEQELWDALLAEVEHAPLDGRVVDLLQRSMAAAVESMDAEWDRRFVRTRGVAAMSPEIFEASVLRTQRVQHALVETLERRLGADGRVRVQLRLVCDMAMSAWRAGAQNWVRRGRGTTPESIRPESRESLVRLVGESFDALRDSLELPADRG